MLCECTAAVIGLDSHPVRGEVAVIVALRRVRPGERSRSEEQRRADQGNETTDDERDDPASLHGGPPLGCSALDDAASRMARPGPNVIAVRADNVGSSVADHHGDGPELTGVGLQTRTAANQEYHSVAG